MTFIRSLCKFAGIVITLLTIAGLGWKAHEHTHPYSPPIISKEELASLYNQIQYLQKDRERIISEFKSGHNAVLNQLASCNDNNQLLENSILSLKDDIHRLNSDIKTKDMALKLNNIQYIRELNSLRRNTEVQSHYQEFN